MSVKFKTVEESLQWLNSKSLSFYIGSGDGFIELEISKIDSEQTPGCNCNYGTNITLKELP